MVLSGPTVMQHIAWQGWLTGLVKTKITEVRFKSQLEKVVCNARAENTTILQLR